MAHNEADFDHTVSLKANSAETEQRPLGVFFSNGCYLFAKAVFDRVAAAILLLFFLPFLAIIVLLMLCFDGSPTLFRHERIGLGKRKFKVFKFRTMVKDADQQLEQLLKSDPAAREEWASTRKLQNDPRVSMIGRFLRKTSLDELPQLLNVLRGDMSLVGPRPIVEDEIANYGDRFHEYQAVKPGITGMWQVNGRGSTTYEERVALDVEYYNTRSFWLDLSLLLRTVPIVLLRRGAC